MTRQNISSNNLSMSHRLLILSTILIALCVVYVLGASRGTWFIITIPHILVALMSVIVLRKRKISRVLWYGACILNVIAVVTATLFVIGLANYIDFYH